MTLSVLYFGNKGIKRRHFWRFKHCGINGSYTSFPSIKMAEFSSGEGFFQADMPLSLSVPTK
jgi:hypothetical protein